MINNRSYVKSWTFGINPETERAVFHTNVWFFDQRDPNQIRKAFDSAVADARARGGKVAFYRTPKVDGPWSGTAYVGQGIGDVPDPPTTN